jgi:CopG antitoxin of type II toxin-antitoxin system
MARRRLQPVNSPEEVPDGLSDEDQIRFWETHEITEEFLAKAELASEDERPRLRTTPITVRFDDFTLGRLKALAESRNVGYQTLLKELVIERLYEEERRQGALPAGQVPDAESVEESPAGEEQETTKRRDW